MTCIDKNNRPSAQDLLQHPLFSSLRKSLNTTCFSDRYNLIGEFCNRSIIKVKDTIDSKV
jgi:hypothetical protein